MKERLSFPKDFLWGSATASYQVEGGIENCDWAQGARDGKVPICGEACDHYNRYEEDFDIATSLGHNAHRLSVEWARIEPEEGSFDAREIEHYREVLRALHKRGMYPMVTLCHFTLPLWFSKKGGWEKRDAPELFARYCLYVVEQFGDLCDNYATMNEPMVVAGHGYISRDWPPFYTWAFLKYLKALLSMIRGHNDTYKLLKKKWPEKEIGIVKHTIVYKAGWNPLDKIAAFFANMGWTYLFMQRVHKQTDWIGVNYYNRKVFGDTRTLDRTDFGWKIDPEGIYDALKMLWKYKKPIYVSESGCSDVKDRFRADYIRDTVKAIQQAIADGVDVRGYCYWSLLDNYEWAVGFSQHFGLVEVNYDTQERTIRPSAYVYKEIIESHKGNN